MVEENRVAEFTARANEYLHDTSLSPKEYELSSTVLQSYAQYSQSPARTLCSVVTVDPKSTASNSSKTD